MKKVINFPKASVQPHSSEPSIYHCFDSKFEEKLFFNELRENCKKERGYDI